LQLGYSGPRWELTAFSRLPSWFRGVAFQQESGRGGEGERGRERSEGICRTNANLLPTRLCKAIPNYTFMWNDAALLSIDLQATHTRAVRFRNDPTRFDSIYRCIVKFCYVTHSPLI